MKLKSLAITVRKVNYSDTSQVVTFYTRDHGLVRGLAKGAHRERNTAYQGPFDLATLQEIVFIPRAGGAAMALITEGTILDGFPGLRARLRPYLASLFILEYLRLVGSEGDRDRELFDLAHAGLRELARGRDPDLVSLAFEAQGLGVAGWRPELDLCVECRAPPREGGRILLDPSRGGIVCPGCSRGGTGPGIWVDMDTVRTLGLLTRWEIPSLERLRVPAGMYPSLRRILRELAIFLLEREPRMLQYLHEFT